MAYVYTGAGALDYFSCRYGKSRLQFRGPPRDLSGRYAVVIGGTETYGKFVADPYPALVEAEIGLPTVNLGCMNAGPDVFLNEPEVFEIAAGAAVTVVQIMGAHNLSNRFYAVHPRRNDRFLRATPQLQAMFPEVDFTEFHFTRHLLRSLRAVGPERFEVLADELRAGWVRRMTEMLARLGGRIILLWLADRPPPRHGVLRHPLRDPVLVDADMIAALKGSFASYVEVVSSAQARAQGVTGMTFGPLDRPAAAELPGPAVHREVAAALVPQMRRVI